MNMTSLMHHRWVLLAGALVVRGILAQDQAATFPLENGRVRLDVRVNGEGPFPFGLDTGASGVAWVSTSLAARLRLPAAEGFRVSDGTTAKSAKGVRVDSLRLGHIEVKGAVVPVLDSGACDAGREVCGTLGLDMFQGHTVTMDYTGRRLLVSEVPLPAAGGDVIDYVPSHGSPRVDIVLAGTKVNAWLDSGNRGTMLLPMAMAKQLPLIGAVTPAGKIGTVVTQYELFKARLAGNLRLGAIVIEQPEVFFTDMVKEPNVGRGILQTLVVTFDTVNQRVRFARPRAH